MFAMYYLWWDRQHWLTHLGGAYPAGNARDPLPAKLDTAGCSAKNLFPGNVLTDISQGLRYDQATPGTISRDVQLAARAGLSGFAVNWIGTGLPNQGPGDNSFNTRLSYLFAAVHKLNAAGTPFSVILNYQSSAKALTVTQFSNDFDYFLSKYGADSTLDHHFSKLPEVIMAGTWKYSDGELAAISKKFRNRMYLLGDEKPASWNAVRAQYLDGTSYYWSSQDPIKNRSSFIALERLAVAVRRTPNPDGSPQDLARAIHSWLQRNAALPHFDMRAEGQRPDHEEPVRRKLGVETGRVDADLMERDQRRFLRGATHPLWHGVSRYLALDR
ncbi:MAG: hypothetical protein M3070_10990 [Actinomycetota bacterium]|nr:hypothetical protein [Actinomycetota bacterium]